MEVQTPILSRHTVTDPYIESFQTNSDDATLFLQTSPEFFMKRLLAAGAPSIFQIGPAFRKSELGSHHNHEFTMLEWYRLDLSMVNLMHELAELVDTILGASDYAYMSVEQLFDQVFSINPHTATHTQYLHAYSVFVNSDAGSESDADVALVRRLDEGALFDLMLSLAQKELCGRVFMLDFPVAYAALARIEYEGRDHGVARRFELLIDGLEIANGYYELLDAEELECRMRHDIDVRSVQKKYLPEPDVNLLSSMRHGLPECSGVAVGLDRLLMLRAGEKSLKEIIPFTYDNC